MVSNTVRTERWIWLGLSTFLAGFFLVLSMEVREFMSGQKEWIGGFDEALVLFLSRLRTPLLSGIAVDITAMGSGTVLLILTSIFLGCLFLRKKYFDFLHLILTALGSAILTFSLKDFFERSRPSQALRLVEVQGFSYPSGHSLSSAAVYFTMAILIQKYLLSPKERNLVLLFALGLILSIGFSRLYLGVHFFSDVTAGILLGIAWASLLKAATYFWQTKAEIR